MTDYPLRGGVCVNGLPVAGICHAGRRIHVPSARIQDPCLTHSIFPTNRKAISLEVAFSIAPNRGGKERNLNILNKGKPAHRRARIPRRIRTPLAALAVAVCMAAAPAASANMNVIDVSGWQSADITRVVDADAAIVKITEGSGYANPSWRSQIEWARQTGKACGGYHYADGGNVTAEVNHYLNQFNGHVGQCVLALDWESNGNAAWGNGDWVRQWVNQVYSRTKVWPIVYVQDSATYQIPSDVRAHCMLWKAQYASMNATGWQSTPWNAGSRGEGMVQYASTGYLNGVGPLDLNLFFGERDAWQKIANGDRGKTNAEVRHDPVRPQVTATPDYNDMATKVIRGVYGNGNERRQALGGAYDTVMAIVNQRLGGSGGAPSAANCGSVCVTVRSGDTLGSIAARNGGTWSQWTGYRSGNPDLIYAGETVCRRAAGSSTAIASAAGGHVVTAGESLWSIYGTGWQAAAQRNGLRSPYTIYPGQRLI